jgi:hypothetical protein
LKRSAASGRTPGFPVALFAIICYVILVRRKIHAGFIVVAIGPIALCVLGVCVNGSMRSSVRSAASVGRISPSTASTTTPAWASLRLFALLQRLGVDLSNGPALDFFALFRFEDALHGAPAFDARIARHQLLFRCVRGCCRLVCARGDFFDFSALIGGRAKNLVPQTDRRPGLGRLFDARRLRFLMLFARRSDVAFYCLRFAAFLGCLAMLIRCSSCSPALGRRFTVPL